MYKQELDREAREPSYYVLPESLRNLEISRYTQHPPQARSTHRNDSINFTPLQTQKLDKTGNLIHLSISDFSGMHQEHSYRGPDSERRSSVYDLGPAPPPFCSADDPQYFGSAMNHTDSFATPKSTLHGDFYLDSTLLRQDRANTIVSPKYSSYDQQYLEPQQTPKFNSHNSPNMTTHIDHGTHNMPPNARIYGNSPAFVFPNHTPTMHKQREAYHTTANDDRVYQAARQIKDDGKMLANYIGNEARDFGRIAMTAGENALIKTAVKTEQIAKKAGEKIEKALEYSDMFVYCAFDAILFFILSKAMYRMNFISHLAMLISLGMSLISILPGLEQVYGHALRIYLGTRLFAVSVGLLIGLAALYPAFAASPNFMGLIYNLLYISDHLLGFIVLLSSLAVAAISYPLFRKMSAMFKELNSQNQHYFTSNN